jgi:hypothetical protein
LEFSEGFLEVFQRYLKVFPMKNKRGKAMVGIYVPRISDLVVIYLPATAAI